MLGKKDNGRPVNTKACDGYGVSSGPPGGTKASDGYFVGTSGGRPSGTKTSECGNKWWYQSAMLREQMVVGLVVPKPLNLTGVRSRGLDRLAVAPRSFQKSGHSLNF